MFRFIFLILALLCCRIASTQNAVQEEIQNLKTAGQHFQKVDLMKFQSDDIHNRANPLEGLKKGTILSLNEKAFQSCFQNQSDFITILVPTTARSKMVLTLTQHEIFAEDFGLFTSSDPDHPVDYDRGLHYKGIVEGDPSSIVAVSIFNEQMMAMIATDGGNFVIGQLEGDAKGRYILYNDRDLDKANDFACGTLDDGLGYSEDQLKPSYLTRDPSDCVRLHVEIDDNIVTGKGGAVNATNYVIGMFNQSIILYAQESINLVISEILAWTTDSPYTGTTQSEMLASYKANTEYFNGDLSQLVTYSAVGGSAAGTNGLCNGNPDLSKCFSHIDTSYNDFPTYSWTVFVITHEVGHLLGSSHTHSCVWNGNNTAIDGCYTPAGGCPLGPIPPDGGTIMSYCYLASSGSFVDFYLGFGEQPGNVIKNSVNAAGNCITACGQPTSYCASNGVTSSSDYINKVVLGSISNTSGNNGGYADYTSLSTTLQAGTTYTITLNPKPQNGNHTDCWKVWIDYNNDFDWYDAGETVGSGSGRQAVSITFTVPAGSPGVTTRMRVSMRYQGCPAFCGTFPYGEVEDYTVVIIPNTPTCADGIQNQDETDIDCGGPCPACPSCSDSTQNQGETGIDCGGPCPACEVGDSTVLLGAYFETGWDTWIDGGQDVSRVNSANSYEGLYSIKLADNDGVQSAMTSPAFDLSSAVGLQISFHFYANSMEAGEDFWVRYNDGSGNWVTIGSFIAGTTFINSSFYQASIVVPGFVPTSAGSLRIQCDANDNNDQVFIDAVVITKLNGTEAIEPGVQIQQIASPHQAYAGDDRKTLVAYPNPAQDVLHIDFNGVIQSVRILTVDGKEVMVNAMDIHRTALDISGLEMGIYFLSVQSENTWYPVKFCKM